MATLIKSLLTPTDNVLQTCQLLLKELNVNIPEDTIKESLESHPDFPSMLALSDTLTEFKILNVGYRANLEQFKQEKTPFVCHIKSKIPREYYFTVIREIGEKFVVHFDSDKDKWTKVDTNDFFKIYNGIILKTQYSEESEEEKKYTYKNEGGKSFYLNYFLTSIIPIIISLSIGFAYYKHEYTSVLPILFLLVTLSGVIICTLLLWHEIDQYNPALRLICSGGKKINCNAVLQSEGAKIFNISWSEIGFIYFTSNSLFILSNNIVNQNALLLVSISNIISLPYVFYSIYYQIAIVKQWCVLCISVQAALILLFTISTIGGWYHLSYFNELNVEIVISFIINFFITAVAVIVFMPIKKKAKNGNLIKNDLLRMKHDPRIFTLLVSEQPSIITDPIGLGITLGNMNATNKIVKVCNPYCDPCAKAHPEIDNLLDSNPNIQVQIIFTATERVDDITSHPVKLFMKLYEEGDENMVRQVLDNWYLAEEKDYHTFISKYPLDNDLSGQNENLVAMSNWCNNNEITHTPTFFVNGHKLPSNYNVKDLKHYMFN